jgi:hypothetical protein
MSLILIALFYALAIATSDIREGLDKLAASCKTLAMYNLDTPLNCEDTLEDLTQQLRSIKDNDDSYEYLLQEIHAYIWSYDHGIQMEEDRRKTPSQISKEKLKPLIDTDNTLLELQGK